MKAPLSTLLGAAVLQVAACLSARAQLPSGAQVVSGDVAIAQAGNAMTVTQASRNAIVNWQSFNLGAGASFRLQQSGADAAMLARVVGHDSSQLLGSLKADGKLFLINPRGVVVGRDAVIDTAAFMASTLDVSDSDFLRGGPLTLQGDSTAGVVNLGKIVAREGNVMLFAHTVKNAGEIDAPRGTAALGAGTEVYLASPDAAGFVIKTHLSTTTEKTGVENAGTIAAAQAQLEAAGGSLYELAVNQSGVVRATGVDTHHGRVLLTAAGGTVGVSGEVSARNADGSGGEILVGGDYRGGNAAVANAARTVVTASGQLDASAASASAKAGRVIVWADDATRFLGSLRATGAGGGFAEVSGKRWLDFNPASTVQLGAGGTLLLDPDALVISGAADSGTSTSGANPFTFGATTTPATLNVTTLQNQLAVSNVILDTSTSAGDITFNSAVTWATNNSLTVRSGNNINVNASLTGGAASTLALYSGRQATAPGEQGLEDIRGEATLASSATISVGKLVYGANAQSVAPAGYTPVSPASSGLLWLYGNVAVGTLEVDLAGGATGVVTNGTDNAIGAFRTSGTGTLSSAYVMDHHGGLDVTLNSATAGGPYLQFITPGTLTLKSGSSLNFASQGTALFASTGGAFVNEAGASVFGANARFLIYSNSTAATTKGGLVGTEVFNHAFNDTDDYSGDAISRFFYSAASGSPILTYTADNLTRTYGAANPTLTYTTTGWQVGVTNDVTGAPTLSTSATQSSGVGGYAVNIGAGTLASSNYDFSFVPGTLTIEKAPLTVTANNATRRVNLANPDFTASYSGFVLGESASALGGTLSLTTPATSVSPVGSYAITPSGLTATNYAITFVPGVLSITNTAALLVTADSFTRTYGAANPTFTATYSGFVGGDNASMVTGLQFSTAATQSSGIGAYTITPFGATAAGYDISYAPGTLTIERAPLTIAVPNQSRLYGDANNITANFNGLVNGDTASVVSGLNLATAATPTSNVGTYGITASGASAANYRITYSPGSLSVLPAPLTVTIADATRRYGDADPLFTYAVGGLKNGDSGSIVTVNNLASLASATAGIGAYGIIGFPSTTSPNYTVPAQVSGTLTITPRPVTITADSQTRLYGNLDAPYTATFSGLASFDTPAIFGPLNFSTQATQTSGVGDWGLIFSNVSHPNYTVTPVFGKISILPAPLKITVGNASRSYGQANPAFTYTIEGLKNGEGTNVIAGFALTTAANATSFAGAYAINVAGSALNYALTALPGTLTINRLAAAITATSASRTYGDALAAFNASFTGFLPGDLALAQSNWQLNNPDRATLAAGAYEVGFSELQPSVGAALRQNYDLTVTPGALTIARRIINISVPNASVPAGELPGRFPATATAPVSGGAGFTVTGHTLATNASAPGVYALTPEIVPDAGFTLEELARYYDFRSTGGVLTITIPRVVKDNVVLDPITLTNTTLKTTMLTTTTTINTNTTFDPVTITLNLDNKITVAAPKDVGYDTQPLTKTSFASYFASFAGQMDQVRSAIGSNYQSFLKGKGQEGSAYETMTPAARALLADWFNGALSVDDLRGMIASGNGDASAAFGFIMPTLIEFTRAKKVEDMTPIDREVLGRLADLTEKRKSDTIRLAQQKYDEMVAAQAERAKLNGLAALFIGPGDFQNIVDRATQEAVGTYIGATLGATAGSSAALAVTFSITAVLKAVFPATMPYVLSSTAAAGPAIVVMNMAVLAVRAVQMSESIKNENDFKALMNSWAPGRQITSIADLKSRAMDKDMQLSTLMLSAELLKPSP